MQRSTVLVLNKSGFLNYFKRNRAILLLAFLFILGITAGVLLFTKSHTVASFCYNRYIDLHNDKSFLYILINSFFTYLSFIFAVFLAGTSLVGVILSPMLVGFCGYLCGLFLSIIYTEQAFKGIAFTAIIFIPSVVFFLVCLLLSARESLNFSFELLQLTFERNFNSADIFDYFRNYCGRYLLLCILPLASAIVDAAFSRMFLNYFL